MKIALINIPWCDDKNPDLWGVKAGSRWPHFQKRPTPGQLPRYIPFPFFMAIAAAELQRRNHQVLIIDGVAENIDLTELYRRLDHFEPEVIFTETATPCLSYDLDVLGNLKATHPNARFISAGVHNPDLIQPLLTERNVPDFWIAGEYEISLADFIDSGFTTYVPGLVSPRHPYKDLASISDVNALPRPLFEQLPVVNYMDPVCGLPTPNAQGWLSRGCPFHCTFCVWPQLVYGGHHYRKRDLDLALDEIEFLIRTYGCESFYFDDDTANVGEQRMVDLAGKIIERGLNVYPWSMMARADCMNDKMLTALAEAGIYSIKYGVESIAESLINACEKKTDLDRLQQAIAKTKALGIKLHLTFTFGLPGETEETMLETARFAIETAPESAQFSICTPFPGTEFYQTCRENGWLTTQDWRQFLGSGESVVINTPQLSSDQLKATYQRVLSMWRSFLDDRMAAREQRLTSALTKAIKSGLKWSFIGDRKLATFLLEDPELAGALKQDISGNYLEGFPQLDERENCVVIVSRHDEERIYRQLARAFPEKSRRLPIYRLYN